jgi:hypothetical protein
MNVIYTLNSLLVTSKYDYITMFAVDLQAICYTYLCTSMACLHNNFHIPRPKIFLLTPSKPKAKRNTCYITMLLYVLPNYCLNGRCTFYKYVHVLTSGVCWGQHVVTKCRKFKNMLLFECPNVM